MSVDDLRLRIPPDRGASSSAAAASRPPPPSDCRLPAMDCRCRSTTPDIRRIISDETDSRTRSSNFEGPAASHRRGELRVSFAPLSCPPPLRLWLTSISGERGGGGGGGDIGGGGGGSTGAGGSFPRALCAPTRFLRFGFGAAAARPLPSDFPRDLRAVSARRFGAALPTPAPASARSAPLAHASSRAAIALPRSGASFGAARARPLADRHR